MLQPYEHGTGALVTSEAPTVRPLKASRISSQRLEADPLREGRQSAEDLFRALKGEPSADIKATWRLLPSSFCVTTCFFLGVVKYHPKRNYI